MESLFRRRFFVFHLACLLAAAFLCARAVNVVVDHELLKLAATNEEKAGAAKAPRPPPSAPNRDFEAASVQNIFEGKREVLVESTAAVVEPGPTGPTGSWESAVLTSLRLRLVGTAVFSDEEFSIASIIEEAKGAEAMMYSLNECETRTDDPNDPNAKLRAKPQPCNRIAESGTVKRIEPEKVYFWNEAEHRYEYVAIDEPPTGKGPAVAKKKEPEVASKDDLGKDIKKVGETSYEVGQGEVDKALNNLADLATQARIVPAFEGGKSVGFKLFSIRPGSLYSKIGLQNGDVINRINGYEITSPDKALEVYSKLKDSKNVTVDVKRRGKPTTLSYAITP